MRGETLEPNELVEITLEQFQFGSEILIPRNVVDNMNVSAEFNTAMQEWMMRINAFIWSEPLKTDVHTVRFMTPATWWDHFKATYLPVWLLKLFPVKTAIHDRKITITQCVVYPRLPLVMPDNDKDPLKFVRHTVVKDELMQ